MSDSVLSLIRHATGRLESVGIENARLDAQLLLGAVLGRSRLDILTSPHDLVTGHAVTAFEALLARRMTREPISHILGRREFWSLEFEVTEATLAPRADSETLILGAIDLFADRLKPRRILDLGTGTGCLLLSILQEFPEAFGVGVDRDPATARVARRNAARLGFGERASFVVGDWASALGARFDLVISNPPYIPSAEILTLDPEVAMFEPLGALDGGADGLDDYRALWPEMPRLLTDDGVAIFEIGATQGPQVAELARMAGFASVEIRPDLAGRDRAVIARKLL